MFQLWVFLLRWRWTPWASRVRGHWGPGRCHLNLPQGKNIKVHLFMHSKVLDFLKRRVDMSFLSYTKIFMHSHIHRKIVHCGRVSCFGCLFCGVSFQVDRDASLASRLSSPSSQTSNNFPPQSSFSFLFPSHRPHSVVINVWQPFELPQELFSPSWYDYHASFFCASFFYFQKW